MGVAVGDYDRNGRWIFKTNFAGDTSTLYQNSGGGLCDDRTFAAGIGMNTRWLGWGTAFVDFDHDGWLDLFLVNGHVTRKCGSSRPRPATSSGRSSIARRQGAFHGRHGTAGCAGHDTESRAAPRSATLTTTGRSTSRSRTSTIVPTSPLIGDPANHWITLTLVGTSSNRNAIGARVRCVTGSVQQWQEVRGGGSYMSQNDPRVNWRGAGEARRSHRRALAQRPRRELGESRHRQVSHLERGRTCRDRRGRRSIDALLVCLAAAILTAAQDPAAALSEARALLDAGKPGAAIEKLQPVVAKMADGSAERREAAQVLGLSHYLAGHIK
jgi:hypothetical protein